MEKNWCFCPERPHQYPNLVLSCLTILDLFVPAWNIALISGVLPPYISLLDRVESKAIRLIGDPSLTSTLDPLSLRRKVASLSLFYRYYFGRCSDELAACIPPPMAQPRFTRQASFAHICQNSPMQELIGSVMVSSLLLPAFGNLSLLLYFRLTSTFLPSFKRQVYRHLRDQMA